MKILCLFAKRTESYPGKYAPELIAAMLDIHYDDYPEWFDKEEERTIKEMLKGEFTLVKRMIVTVNDEQFDREFYGKPINGTIKEES